MSAETAFIEDVEAARDQIPVLDLGPYLAGEDGVPEAVIDRGFAELK